MLTTRQQGNKWENVAEKFLKRRGLKTLKKNFLVACGEIDLVMLDGQILVFTEVRYRRNIGHGSGAESVTWTKQRKIIRAAELFLKNHPYHRFRPCRFDIVSIGIEDGEPILDWIRGAFDAG